MKYDFTSVIDRHGKDALAVEALGLPGFPAAPKAGFDAIPMWVADMNFPTAPAIVEALQKRAAHPLYGYFLAPEAYYNAIIRWQKARNGVTGLEAKRRRRSRPSAAPRRPRRANRPYRNWWLPRTSPCSPCSP